MCIKMDLASMLPALLASLLITYFLPSEASTNEEAFTYQGFHGANLSLNGVSAIEPGGALRLTNYTKQAFGHAFFPTPFDFVNSSTGNPRSFSTAFVFAIIPQYQDVRSHGLAFALSPSIELTGAQPSQYLGLFNLTNNGNHSNHIVAVELDTVQNLEYSDIDDNHVGIDIDSLRSVDSASASYYTDSAGRVSENVSLISRQPMQLWVEYHSEEMRLDVTLSPAGVAKPPIPLVSSRFNLSSFVVDKMYVGFSAANGGVTASNYILGWSFSLNGQAEELDISKLPSLPQGARKQDHVLPIALSLALFVLLAIATVGLVLVFRRMKYAEVREDWEIEYGPNRISYRDLYRATKGFSDENMLGAGGFGGVYRGVLPKSKHEVAVKRVSNDSRQGMKEFVAEIVSVGRVRHRNLVQLLGYSRRQGELLLVYDFMPNGSLDKYLYDRPQVLLNWSQRLRVIRGIAAGLLYLHEEWEQVVLHRDIKASNVLLDREFNGKLGDFGLARLYHHDRDPQATHVVGSLGYLAPELSRTGIATTFSDVYAFGAFLLEVACGRRPIELKTWGVELVLVDWVLDFLKKGMIVEARDRRLGNEFVLQEVEMVLKLGLLCSHPVPMTRPSMRQVVQYLAGDAQVPNMSEDDINVFEATTPRAGVFGDSTVNCAVDVRESSAFPFSVTETELLSAGR